jgi:hypothetical protein
VSNAATFELHVLMGSGRLGPRLGAIEQQIAAAFHDAAARLDLGGEPLDIVVRDAPAVTIPELGIGGVAPDQHTIFIGLNPGHPRFEQAIGRELARTTTHELDHIARRRQAAVAPRCGRRSSTRG